MGPLRPSAPDRSIPSLSGATEDTVVDGAADRPLHPPALGRGDSVGRYLLVDPLGRGAMGQVFRAYDPDLDRQVAIKILFERGRPDARDRLLREAKAMARIHHPHVITVHDAGMHEGAVFIAMEIVDGPSLDRWLATGGRSPAEILDALVGAARGLAAAHAAGVIHRDFKPANVLVTADGRAKVGDFGLAGIEDPVTGPAAEDPHVIGTPAYMSPEQFAGVGVDARSDQFAFAITLHEALYGARPFTATTWPELVAQVTRGEVSPELAARRSRIDAIIRRALAVDPALRFESMDALLAALERARRPVWRPWAIGAAAVVALAVGLGLAARQREEDETCAPGEQHAEAVWNRSARAALRIGGNDYTEAFARKARDRFAQALDDYAARWAVAHDESCAAVGPRADGGTAAEQRTAQCLANRLDSLRGLAELASSEPLDVGSVEELVDTLPALEDCTSERWVPYPPEPERAARAAELHRRLDRIQRLGLADRGDTVVQEADDVVAQARELDDAYVLALALHGRASLLDADPRASAMLDEALERALAGGHDHLAATIINAVLLTSTHDEAMGTTELVHLVAAARGLVERSGGDERLLGRLALNEARLLRRAGRIEDAMVRDREAEEHYARAGDDDGVTRARINNMVSLLRLGRLESVTRELPRTVQALEESSGETSPAAFQARTVLIASLSYAGRMQEAFETADASYRQARELFTPESYTLRRSSVYHAMAAANIGRTEDARRTIEHLRASTQLPEDKALELETIELLLLETELRHDEALRRIPALQQRAMQLEENETGLTLDMMEARSLLLLGRPAEAVEVLTSPRLRSMFERNDVSPDLESDAALLGVLSGAPPPPGRTWHSIAVAETPPMLVNRRVAEAVEAIERGGDATDTVRSVRDELVRLCHARDVDVQLLDAWLAGRLRPAP